MYGTEVLVKLFDRHNVGQLLFSSLTNTFSSSGSLY